MGFGKVRLNALVVALILVATLSCVVGATLLGELSELSPEAHERRRIENVELEKRLEAERPAHVLWAYGWRLAIIVTVLSALAVLSIRGLRWATSIAPDRRGLYPVVQLSVGQAKVLHDPNKALTATTIYTTPQLAESVAVIPVLPAGAEGEQAQVTGRAQAVQALAAIASGNGGGNRSGEWVAGLLGAAQKLAPPHPQPRRSPWESSHVERLLIESGALDEPEEAYE